MSAPTLQQYQFEIGARMGRRDFSAAAATAAECRTAWPDESLGWLLGSIAALMADEKQLALALVTERLVARPDDVQCLLQKAECELAIGDRNAALQTVETALIGASITALDAIGEFLVHAAEQQRALAVYDRALALSPRDPSLLGKRAVVHRFLGNFDAADSDYEALLRTTPGDAEALKARAELRRQTAHDNGAAALRAALASVSPASKEAATLHFGLAKTYEDLGDHAASWRHLAAGNRIERTSITYNPNTDRQFMERIIAAFADPEPQGPPTTPERPIFIVGLPRSGTTLLERILSSHSAVHAAGELPALSEAIGVAVEESRSGPVQRWLEYASALGNLNGATIAREYLARSRSSRGKRERFLDKQPINFLYCGPILRAFPDTPVLHLTRHPLAACYALFKVRFRGTYPFSYQMDELASFYIGYRRMMDHWHRILAGRILDVAYEDLVLAQEATTRRVLAHIGLPFEPACLDFHLNPQPTTTASAVQVREPIYSSSLDQWRNYAEQLAPLRARIEAAGIAVD